MTDSPRHWLELDGQLCAVTGAASGIGAAIAHSLAQAGAKVVLLDRDAAGCEKVAGELVASGATALAVACDTSSEASVNAAAQRVLDQLGPCYALINNAGMLRPGGLADVSIEDWNAVLAVNLTGYLLCARAFGAQMRKAGRGSIVHVASIAGLTPQTSSGAYSASKAGVLQLSRQMAVEWGPQGIRSNAICPGMIRTALSARFYEEPGFEAKRAAVTASRRVGEPQDIADVALFLASPRAAYVNGAELSVDGGMSSMLMDMVPRPGFNMAPTLVTSCTALPPEGAELARGGPSLRSMAPTLVASRTTLPPEGVVPCLGRPGAAAASNFSDPAGETNVPKL